MQLYKELDVLKPVFDFYYDNRENGLDKAFREFENQVGEKDRLGNIAFRIKDDRLHEQQVVYNAIIEKFEIEQAAQLSGQQKVCLHCELLRNKPLHQRLSLAYCP